VILPNFYHERDVNQMLYVAVTRARSTVVIVSTENILKNIIGNFQKKRKSHFPDYICPILDKFYNNSCLQITEIPARIRQKISEDDEIVKGIRQKIIDFRSQHNMDMPSLKYKVQEDDVPLEISADDMAKLENLMKSKKTKWAQEKKRDLQTRPTHNDVPLMIPITKKPRPAIYTPSTQSIGAEVNPLLETPKVPSFISSKRKSNTFDFRKE